MKIFKKLYIYTTLILFLITLFIINSNFHYNSKLLLTFILGYQFLAGIIYLYYLKKQDSNK
jgi:hypothetical protein